MKITKSKLQRIIREEIYKLVESDDPAAVKKEIEQKFRELEKVPSSSEKYKTIFSDIVRLDNELRGLDSSGAPFRTQHGHSQTPRGARFLQRRQQDIDAAAAANQGVLDDREAMRRRRRYRG